MSKKNVVVVGATGALGSKIAEALMEQGAEVTAMVRATSNREKLINMGVTDFITGDMMDRNSLKAALSPSADHPKGFDAIVSSAAGYTRHSKGDSTKTDTLGYRNLADATKKAGIPRFVLISILESDKAVNVPHFHNKYLTEQYLSNIQQPYIALRPGVFFDFSVDLMIKKIKQGIVPVFFEGVDYGTIYTPDLARYAAMAALSLPDSELNTSIDVGWSEPVNNKKLAAAFEKVLKKPMKDKPVIPSIVIKVVAPVAAAFNSYIRDMYKMIKWVKTGVYVSRNTQRQKKLFGDLPSIEEGVRRFCRDMGLLT